MDTHALKVDPDHDGTRLDVFLTAQLPDIPSRNFVKKLIEGGHVRVNESLVKGHHKVRAGDDVHVEIPGSFLSPQYAQPENIPLDIFYQDENLFVINKPSGLLVHPAPGRYSGTMTNALLYQRVALSTVNTALRPGIVHRLDQETSGLLLVAKDNITHTKLAKQFQRHTIKKQYLAWVEGTVEFDEGKVDAPIGRHPRHRELKAVLYDDSARESLTFYKVLRREPGRTLIVLSPRTGRTHQLRVHMAFLKHPILGDPKYGRKQTFSRLALHAQAIGFRHPRTKQYVEFCSSAPKEFWA